ncbi:MAG TPA: hypothetical protein PLS19_03635 [bacterium]|nr:hypothetical protein [bacterium]HPN93637.1 hypothetical protein [bacterium]
MMKDFDREMSEAFRGAFERGIGEALSGGRIGESIGKEIKSGLKRAIGEAIRGAAFGGGGATGFLAGGAGGGGIIGGGLGGALGKLLGSELSFFGGGAGGVVGGLLSIASMTGLLDKKKKPEMSGVEEIFKSGTAFFGGDMSQLYGSEVFERAAFSSRNADGGMLRKFAEPRMSPEVTVHIKPSREFDAISEDKWVRSSVMNSISGLPRRTNFNHG